MMLGLSTHGCLLCGVSSANGVYIGTVTGMDPSNFPYGFTLVNANGGPFSMNINGSLFVNTSLGWLDYEVKSVYNLTIQMSQTSNFWNNGTLLTASQGLGYLTVNVVDVAEMPYIVSFPTWFDVPEHSPVRTVVNQSSPSLMQFYDEDFGNNSALSVSVVTGSTYLEVVNSTGGACLGAMPCVLRIRTGSPDTIDYAQGVHLILFSIFVLAPTGLNFTVTGAVNIDQLNYRKYGSSDVMCV